MEAVAHNKAFAKKVGIPQSVGKDFAEADKGKKFKSGGLYANIHAKQERIAHGSGEHMRKPGAKGAPTAKAFKESAKTAKMKKGGVSLSVGRGEKLPVSKGAGLTAKGRAKYNKATGSKLKAPTKDPKNPRHKSFCARSKSWKGERGKAARRRWGCSR